MCDEECVSGLRNQIYSLKAQLNVYKPILLALTTVLVCFAIWFTVLTFTGKRKEKLKRLLRRDQFVSEVEAGDSDSSQDVGSMTSDDLQVTNNETMEADRPPSSSQAKRSGKISLPARMSDLYQTYPGDKEGMVVAQVPEITLTRPSVVSIAQSEETQTHEQK